VTGPLGHLHGGKVCGLTELARINTCRYTPIIIRAFHLLGRLRCGLQ
jgi:hypothetical protein